MTETWAVYPTAFQHLSSFTLSGVRNYRCSHHHFNGFTPSPLGARYLCE
ncbi:hypothetical protein HMPREF0454_00679 [Hafnia alvei ATCC 51873]|uniref:Uncharacterized protein n=1 Tax=Hafnia alvei ATCC 51873 TaxID=1002364 RepID=G9Y267_HAFAL|nr:hypothetical protein HMPREF0454_00679 [Hafnia alvei ATCC 51873]